MSNRVGENLVSNLFSGVTYAQELNEAKSKIAQLTAEIKELRAVGKKEDEQPLVSELLLSVQNQAIIEVPVSEIEVNPAQPRQTFSDESLTLLARSIERDGLQQPLLVFQISDDRYFLFDGERRYRATTQKLFWKKIKIINLGQWESNYLNNPETLRRKALLANHHRENLNPLDLAEVLVKEISILADINEESIPKTLNTVIKRLTRQGKLKWLSELTLLPQIEQENGLSSLEIRGDENKILKVLLGLHLNPASINNNIFPSLKLFEDLKKAIRTDGLGGHHARVLQRLSTETLGDSSSKIRHKLTRVVINEKLSVAQTRQLITDEISKIQNNNTGVHKSIQKAINSVEKVTITDVNPKDLKAFETVLKQKLKEVKEALKAC